MKKQSSKNRKEPPVWVDKCLNWLCDPYLLEGILGDLYEKFEERVEEGNLKKARRKYVWDAIGFARPFTWKKKLFALPLIFQRAMLSNYFKVAIRSLVRYKGHSLTNILGLTVGITGCLLIGLFVFDEWKFDTYHPDAERTYRVYDEISRNTGVTHVALTPPMFGPTIEADFPEVDQTLRIMNVYGKKLFQVGETQYLEENGIFAEPQVFNFFELEVNEGDITHALEEPNALILTQTMKEKYFGNEPALGEIIKVDGRDAKVTAIIADLNPHFHLEFDYLISFETVNRLTPPERMQSWVWQQFYTYVKLKPNSNREAFATKLPAFAEKHAYEQTEEYGFTYTPHIQSLAEIHLNSSDFTWDIAKRGNGTYVLGLSIIGIFLLVIACINFVNLSTARAERRAKEVGVRKVAGAVRGQIVFQFLGESILLSLISTLLALGFTISLLPNLNQFTDKEISFDLFAQPQILLTLLGLTVLIGLFAGIYPSLFISRFEPVRVIKGSRIPGNVLDILFRKGLVVVQFSLSLLLIISTIIIYNQVTYLNDKDLGFDQEYVLTFPMKGKVAQAPMQAKSEFLRLPGVVSVTSAYGFPGDIVAGDNIIVPERDENMSANLFIIDHDYIKTMGMEVIAGRDFSEEFSTDVDEGFIINETAVREMGFGSPEEAIGRELHWPKWNHNMELKKGRVVGVVRDFHYKSLHEQVAVAVLHIYPSAAWKMALRINGENVAETLNGINEVWDGYETGNPIDYQFIDASFDKMYKAEEKLSSLLGIFTLLSIFVACLGLLGLVSFAAEKRTREIGIRKVLGASMGSIVSLISKDFLLLIIISLFIGTPLAWYFMTNWLANFPYQFDLNLWTFVFAGAGIIMIALLTVGLQALKAAIANPIESLRSE